MIMNLTENPASAERSVNAVAECDAPVTTLAGYAKIMSLQVFLNCGAIIATLVPLPMASRL
jgi:hypothetical protein